MDNLTHSMAGWVLGQAGLKTQTRKGLAALMLGANMPDIDVFFGWVDWAPLAIHRGFTHSLVGGVLVMPPFLAGLLWLLDRLQLRRGASFRSGLAMHFGWLLALSYLGAVTHPLLDLLTTYSVQLFSPFSSAWYHADALFIIDLWLWILFAGAIVWSRLREKRGRPWKQPAQAAITIALAYIGVNLMVSDRAVAAVRHWSGDRPVETIFASPPPVKFWRRGLVWRDGDCYRRSRFDPLGSGLEAVTACKSTNLGEPLVREALRSDPELRAFLRWSVLPTASIERGNCLARILVADARYGDRTGMVHEAAVPIRAAGC